MVESQPSKLLVASSILVSRSIFFSALLAPVFFKTSDEVPTATAACRARL